MNELGTEKVGRLLAKFAVPGIISMVVNALYNIVDQIFIGQGVGYLGNGATNVIFPLTTFMLACSFLIGEGAAAYMSLELGKGENGKAADGTAAGIVGTIAVGIIICIIYQTFLPSFCRLFGATDLIMPYALDYGRIIVAGLPFCSICCGISSIIRADGSPGFNMAGLLCGCIINVILDPLFIFVFGMGVKGAALATILGQVANAGLNIFYLTVMKMKSVKLSAGSFAAGKLLRLEPVIMRLGVSSFIQQFTIVILLACQNNLLVIYGAKSIYGSEIPLTAMGITMKVFSILLAVIIGLSGGAQPILGYNYGSRQYERVKKTYRYALTIATIIMFIAFISFQTKPELIMSIFGSDSELYTEFCVKCLRTYLLFIPVGGVQMVSGVFFQALGYPVQSALIALSKQIIFQLPFMFILSAAIGVEGVLWAGPVSDAFALLMSLVLLKIYWKKIFETEWK